MLVMHIQFHSNLPITSSVVGVEDGVSDSKLAMTVAFSSRDGLANLTLVDTYIRSLIALTSFLQDFTNHNFADMRLFFVDLNR